ncbi:MAG: stage II sporulation protein P [Lachnospiraceae bacterium]|nr:stage II sporulation protein P [Lachnospiraceae bacterium]
MYLYQTVRRKQERKIKVMLAVCFVGMLLFFVENDKMGSNLKKELSEVFGREIVSYCVPLVEYYDSPAEAESMQDYILQFFFPILGQGRKEIYYQTEIESAFSYEMILAMEAADENYIDASGQVVGDTSVAEIELDDGLLEQINWEDEQNTTDDEIVQGEVTAAGDEAVRIEEKGRVQKMVTYSREKLDDFDYLIQKFYRVDRTTTINSSQLNASQMLAKDMTLTHNADSPQILIYHTHSQEGYVDSIPGDMSTTVVGVGDYLTELLQEQYGLNVIHHTGQYDVETRDDAYSLAGPAVEKILAEHPSIEVIIDLHRDGVGENTHLVTNMDGVDMAKIMFVNGLSRTTSVGEIGYLYNPNLADNLAFSFQNQLTMAEYYPGLSRGVYLKGYRYNLHYCPKSLLVEVGAQTNTLQEALNAMVPLADVLHKVVTGEMEH